MIIQPDQFVDADMCFDGDECLSAVGAGGVASTSRVSGSCCMSSVLGIETLRGRLIAGGGRFVPVGEHKFGATRAGAGVFSEPASVRVQDERFLAGLQHAQLSERR